MGRTGRGRDAERTAGRGLGSRLLERLAGLAAALDERGRGWTLAGITRDRGGLVFRRGAQEVLLPAPAIWAWLGTGPVPGEERILGLVTALEERRARLDDLPLDLVVAALLPQVRRADELAGHGAGSAAIPARRLGGGLAACSVVDDGDGMVFVTEAHLARWGLPAEAVANLARHNLAGLAGPPVLPRPDELREVRMPAGYAAATLLLLPVDGGLRVAMPDRDLCLVAGPEVPLTALARAASVAHDEAGHPISAACLALRPEGLVALDPAPSNPR
ncbi:MAG: hypothetical protein R3F30_09520 [Planctomycetota bacterium]